MKGMLLAILTCIGGGSVAVALSPEVADLSFGSRGTTNQVPGWIRGVEQDGGAFRDAPNCWQVDAAAPVGQGRLSIQIDRNRMQEDLALEILFQEDETADLVVQLYDADNRVIVLDLFANVIAVGRDAKTDVFIVPLRQYPSATRITLRRIRGEIKVFGLAAYPVVGLAEGDEAALKQLATLLGDPLGPDNPLAHRVQRLAQANHLPLVWRPVDPRALKGGRTSRPAASDRITDWMALAFPKNSDWPGPKGFAAILGNGFFLSRGQPIRSRQVFEAPATVSLEAVLEERLSNGGGLWIWIEPEDVPPDEQGAQAFIFALDYNRPSGTAGEDTVRLSRLYGLGPNFKPDGRELWSRKGFTIRPGHPHQVALELLSDHTGVSVDGYHEEIAGIAVPFQRFHVTVWTWQPTNRWHVRNLRVQ